MRICLIDETEPAGGAIGKPTTSKVAELAARWGLQHDPNAIMALVITPYRLELRKRDEPRIGGVWVDFSSPTLTHRRRFGGGRGEAISKAVGIKNDYFPTVVDATAGLGTDAFVLAALGCHVLMLERHPIVAALLHDGLMRGYADPVIGNWLQERLKIKYVSSHSELIQLDPAPHVVYLDPMYPQTRTSKKQARVKKAMHMLQMLVGMDEDAAKLLTPARQLATKRVVVKRPDHAGPLAEVSTSSFIATKNHRFDIYAPLAKNDALR